MRLLLLAALFVPLLDHLAHTSVLSPACLVLLYLMLAQGLNLIVGFAGLLHLGYAAFFAIGAFAMAYLTSPQSPLNWQLNFFLALPLCVLISALLGALLAWPTLRLRGDYLAIVTMGFGLMLDPLLRNYDDVTKAITGLSAVGTPFPSQSPTLWYYLLLCVLLGCIGISYRVRHSSFGRALSTPPTSSP
jgi:branched-chain amino acid transport system permease protein